MGVSWMKKGSDAAALEAQAKKDAEVRRQSYGKLFRFFMEEKTTKEITFVDGALDPKTNALDQNRTYEHRVFLNGKWDQLVCPEKTNPTEGLKCPLCKGGDVPSLVALFTVIDHSEYKGKNTVYKDTRKLYAAKAKTYEMLNQYAQALGGLVGQRFKVTRSGDKDPAVGNIYIPTAKGDPEVLKKQYIRTWKDKEGKEHTEVAFTVADYEKEIVYRTPDELAQLVGAPSSAPASQTPESSAPAGEEYKSQL